MNLVKLFRYGTWRSLCSTSWTVLGIKRVFFLQQLHLVRMKQIISFQYLCCGVKGRNDGYCICYSIVNTSLIEHALKCSRVLLKMYLLLRISSFIRFKKSYITKCNVNQRFPETRRFRAALVTTFLILHLEHRNGFSIKINFWNDKILP